ncbi:MAG: putative bifunctional diguanylate cyclase/phosphodiesterase [Acidimicrobiales bacterium]
MDPVSGVSGGDGATHPAPELAARLLAAVGEAVVATDLDGRVFYWNDAAQRLYGWTPDEVAEVQVHELVRPLHPERGPFRSAAHGSTSFDEAPNPVELEVVAKDGRTLWVSTVRSPIRDAAGGVIGELTTSHDISLRRAREQALRESETRFRALIQRSKDVAVIVDVGGTLRYVSPGVTDLLGYSPAELVGTDGWALVHPDDLPQLRSELGVVARTAGARATTEYRIRTVDGSYRWIEQTVANLVDEPVIGAVVANLRDITDRKLVEADLNHRVLHDQLTGLPNRAHLDEALVLALSDTSGAAVLVFDIDQFKLINDSYGHAVGDELLTQVSARLQHALRPGDMAGRFGGDEFVVVCRDVHDVAEAELIANRLQSSLATPFELSGAGAVQVSASVGIAAGVAGTAPSELFGHADAAMYEAKRAGRARHVVYDDAMRSRAAHRLRSESELREAIEAGQIEVRYQPIVNLRTGRLVSAEALARWRHPTRGLLEAGEFIGVAEDSGLIIEMGRLMLDLVLDQQARWTAAGHDLVVGINLSALQLSEPTLVSTIAGGLASRGLAPAGLALEITETAVMADPQRGVRVVHELVDLGTHVALDDFGTGYSSLVYLKQLPVTSVKIDQSFVGSVDTRPDDYDIVAAVAHLTRSFGRLLIAEGVETEGQLEVLKELGCHLGQGTYWSAPVAPEPFEGLLSEASRR